jgi:RNA polymerase sigma-70 factor, ECF subfamily
VFLFGSARSSVSVSASENHIPVIAPYAWPSYTPCQQLGISRAILEFFAFDRAYIDRLRDGDPAVESHFFAYFRPFFQVMLRSRATPPDVVDDISQESFTRVLFKLRKDGGINEPDRFGAFVCSICKNVWREKCRSDQRNVAVDDSHYEIADKLVDLDSLVESKELMKAVREILNEMPARDSAILRAMFLEEKDKDEICRDFRIDRDYLRVCLHRAKEKFRFQYEKRQKALRPVNSNSTP